MDRIKVERCADLAEALSLILMARRNGLRLRLVTPRTHGFWGVYL